MNAAAKDTGFVGGRDDTSAADEHNFSQLAGGNHRLPCPECSRSPRDRTMSVSVLHDRTLWHCHRCDQSGARWHAASTHTRLRARAARPPTLEQHDALAPYWQAIWQDLKPIQPTPVADYLQARGCALPPQDGDIRFGELKHPSGIVGPCMVALITDVVTGEPLSLHRTWIHANGQKADVDPPRLLLARHRKKGGVIRLWRDEAVGGGLAVAEGVETALTVATVYTPVWALIDAGNMAAFTPLDGIECLTICGDHDDAGIRAADACAQRWARAGREVRIVKSPVPGQEINDFARAL